jgi:hypothetical protein
MFTVSTVQDPIVVQINGPESFSAADSYPQIVQYNATVYGGSGPYYYHWGVRYCQWANPNSYGVEGEDCQVNYGYLADGWNLNTVSIEIWEAVTKVDLFLELKEAPDAYTTGTAGLEVYGPYFGRAQLAGGGSSPFRCSFDYIGRRPFDEWAVRPGGTWGPTGREYGRNVCSGAREFDPAKPDTIKR